MKKTVGNSIFVLVIFIFGVLLLFSCTDNNNDSTEVTPTITATMVQTFTPTPVLSPTATVFVTATPTPDPNIITFDYQYSQNEIKSGQGNALVLVEDGGYLITGEGHEGDQNYNFYAIKIDRFGQQEWLYGYDFSDNDRAQSATSAIGGGFVIAGWSHPEDTNDPLGVTVLKIDEQGNELWSPIL